jgi:hypothetical protein
MALVAGTSVCLRRVDPALIFPLVREHRVTHMCGAPIVYNMLINAPAAREGFGHVVKGLIAVDPRYIPLGTRLYIPGYGFAVAADTGGGVKGRFVDLGYSDNDYQSWSRVITIYFLTPTPPAGSIVWLIPQSIP